MTIHRVLAVLGSSIVLSMCNAPTSFATDIYIAAPDKEKLFSNNSPFRLLVDNYFKQHLPTYKPKYQLMTFKRFWLDVQSGKDICHMFAKPQKFDINTLESRHATLLFPVPSLILDKESAKQQGIDHSHSAESVMNNTQLIGGYNVGRRYSPYMQNLLREKSLSQTSALFGGHFTISRLHKMLINKRLDYFIGVPASLSFISEADLSYFVVLSFKIKTPYTLKLVCSQSDKHKRFIKQFDAQMANWYNSPHFSAVWQLTFPNDRKNGQQVFTKFVTEELKPAIAYSQ